MMAETGGETLKVIQLEPPDVVFLDIWMPDIAGLEVLKLVRKQFPNVPVIMMSRHGSVETALQAKKLGAYDYLEKPLDLEEVPILVRNAIRESAASEKWITPGRKYFAVRQRTGELRAAVVRDLSGSKSVWFVPSRGHQVKAGRLANVRKIPL